LPERTATRSIIGRGLASLLLIALIALSWTGFLEQQVEAGTGATLKRALATYAVARGLNGVISVAQGTEIAIQPVGIGVTLTAGEILDPLNDLVEQFSSLVLVACASLGTQMLMTELLSEQWVSGVMTGVLVAYLLTLWVPPLYGGRTILLRACTMAVFVRFVFAVVALFASWLDTALLAERQDQAVAQISLTRDSIEELQSAPTTATEDSLLQRFGDFIDEQRQALNIDAELTALGDRVEAAIEDLIRLMVLFVVQTIVIPIAGVALAYAGCRWLWRSGAQPRA
jgi:hypothetical protein